MKRFFVRSKNEMPKGLSAQKQEVHQGAYATTPERLMAAITNQMGEICNDKQEFDELLVLLMSKAPRWVKEVAMTRDHNVRSEAMQGKPPKPLIL